MCVAGPDWIRSIRGVVEFVHSLHDFPVAGALHSFHDSGAPGVLHSPHSGPFGAAVGLLAESVLSPCSPSDSPPSISIASLSCFSATKQANRQRKASATQRKDSNELFDEDGGCAGAVLVPSLRPLSSVWSLVP